MYRNKIIFQYDQIQLSFPLMLSFKYIQIVYLTYFKSRTQFNPYPSISF